MRKILVFSVLVLCFFLFSCKIEKVQVGNYNALEGKSIVYDKGKDIYLFWDQVPLQRLESKIEITDYEKIVKRNLFDNVVYYGSMGIFSFHTVKIVTKSSTQEKDDKNSGK